MYFGGVPPTWAPLLVLLALAATAYAARRQTFRVARPCSLCGKALCKRCQRVITPEMLCTQCHNFLQKRDRLGHALREQKTAQILRHVRRFSRAGALLSRALPGAGHIWKGRPVTGAAVLFVFLLMLLLTVLPWLVAGPWEGHLTGRAEMTGMLGAGVLAYWGAAALAALKVRGRADEDSPALKTMLAGQ
jgi:hypothetical protein